ncbi:MAG: lysylphosphatidylglycerol synthase domain-containing protein [Candidatus Dojkabacteria bacterium]|nr:lysylphosphatidylglycerol synthase domain-containing protein [Candidatus Dojkabacteria bacterium]
MAVTVFFWGKALITNVDRFKDISLAINIWNLALGSLLYGTSIAVSGITWAVLLRRITDTTISIRSLAGIHIKSWIYRYIPGKVGLILSKISMASRRGISRSHTALSIVYDYFFMVVSSFILSIPLLKSFLPTILNESQVRLLLASSTALLVIAVLAVSQSSLFIKIINIGLQRILHKNIPRIRALSLMETISMTILYMFPRLASAVSFLFITLSVTPIPQVHIYETAAAYIVATIIGLFALFAPSGIGVREGVIVLVLSTYMPFELAVAISVIARLSATVMDLIVTTVVSRKTLFRKMKTGLSLLSRNTTAR